MAPEPEEGEEKHRDQRVDTYGMFSVIERDFGNASLPHRKRFYSPYFVTLQGGSRTRRGRGQCGGRRGGRDQGGTRRGGGYGGTAGALTLYAAGRLRGESTKGVRRRAGCCWRAHRGTIHVYIYVDVYMYLYI